MRKADKAIRQRARICLALAAGKMQKLRPSDFADVPAGRTRNGTFVCGLLSGIWDFAGHDQVAVLYLPDRHFDRDGSARTPASRPDNLAGVCSWARVLRRRAA